MSLISSRFRPGTRGSAATDWVKFMATATHRHIKTVEAEASTAEALFASLEADAPPRMKSILASVSEDIRTSSGAVPPRYTVALMGRTQAGKSTLMSALTGASEDAIGWPGRQRHTRAVSALQTLDLDDVELIDTPGVGALDAPEDRALALAQLDRAHVVVWVAPNDGFQEDTAESLRLVAAMGKPIVVVLNCKADLRQEINLVEFLEDPDHMLTAADGHLEAIRRHLREAGAEPLAEVVLHAQAAFFGRKESEHAPCLDDGQRAALEEASRISLLVDVLRREVRSDPRKVLGVAHPGRFGSSRLAGALRGAAAELATIADSAADRNAEVHKRHGRAVDDSEARMLAAVRREVSMRRTWTEDLSLGQLKDADARWREQQDLLAEGVKEAIRVESERLQVELEQVLQDVDDEFGHFEHDGFEMPDFGEAWLNRMVKLGGKVALSAGGATVGAIAGGFIGGLAGSFVVPGIGTVSGVKAGEVIGGIVGAFAAAPLGRLVDTVGNIFRSETEILRRMRESLRKRSDEFLEKVQPKLEESVRQHTAKVRADLAKQDGENDSRVQRLRRAAAQLEEAVGRIEATTAAFDADTAVGLVGAAGHSIDRGDILEAYRYPGHGIVVRIREPAFSGLVLNPPRTPEPVAPVSISAASPAADVAQVLISLTGSAFQVADRDGTVRATLADSVRSRGQREAWEDLASRVTHMPVSIVAEEMSSEWTGSEGERDDNDKTLAA